MSEKRSDDTERKPWYGSGKQVWDILLEETPWTIGFAAANVLKYLRRPGKNPIDAILDQCPEVCEILSQAIHPETGNTPMDELRWQSLIYHSKHSLESARWYYARLNEWAFGAKANPYSAKSAAARLSLSTLHHLLTPEEKQKLEG